MLTSTTGAPLLTPAQVTDLFVRPALAQSIAGEVSTVINIDANALRVPVLGTGPAAAFVSEGAEIPVSDAQVSELLLTPAKVAALSVISSELADDSSPEAAGLIGAAIANEVAKTLDKAYFGALAAPAPSGLEALSGIQTAATTYFSPDDQDPIANLDAFGTAVGLSAASGGTLTHWVTSPETATMLSNLKQGDSPNSKLPLLQPDPTKPTTRVLLGLPILVSTAVAPDTVWGISKSDALLVVRKAAEIVPDRSVFFTSDRVAIRGIMRATFGFPRPATVVKVTITPKP